MIEILPKANIIVTGFQFKPVSPPLSSGDTDIWGIDKTSVKDNKVGIENTNNPVTETPQAIPTSAKITLTSHEASATRSGAEIAKQDSGTPSTPYANVSPLMGDSGPRWVRAAVVWRAAELFSANPASSSSATWTATGASGRPSWRT